MLSRFPLKYLSMGIRCYTKSDILVNNIDFPYKFGNTLPITRGESKSQEMAKNLLFSNRNIYEGTKIAYRAILTKLSEGDFDALNMMLERNLYNRFKSQYESLKNKGYSLKVYNENSQIDVEVKSVGLIIGGSINRSEERGFSKNFSAMGLDSLVYIDFELDVTSLKYIVKFTFELKTTCKLVLINTNDKKVHSKNQLQAKEIHELTLEGESLSADMNKPMSNFLKEIKQTAMSGMKFDNATAVDFDNALNGNKHTGSTTL